MAVFADQEAQLRAVRRPKAERFAQVLLRRGRHDTHRPPRPATILRNAHPDRLVVRRTVGLDLRVVANLAKQRSGAIFEHHEACGRHPGGKIGGGRLPPRFAAIRRNHDSATALLRGKDNEIRAAVRADDALQRGAVAVRLAVGIGHDLVATRPRLAAIGGLRHRPARSAMVDGPYAIDGAVRRDDRRRMPLIDAIRARGYDGLPGCVMRQVDDRQFVMEGTHVGARRIAVRRGLGHRRDFFRRERARLEAEVGQPPVEGTVAAGCRVAERALAALEWTGQGLCDILSWNAYAIHVEFGNDRRTAPAYDGHVCPASKRQRRGELPGIDAARRDVLGHMQAKQQIGRVRHPGLPAEMQIAERHLEDTRIRYVIRVRRSRLNPCGCRERLRLRHIDAHAVTGLPRKHRRLRQGAYGGDEQYSCETHFIFIPLSVPLIQKRLPITPRRNATHTRNRH